MKAATRRLVRNRAERLFAVRGGSWLDCVHQVIVDLRHEGIAS